MQIQMRGRAWGVLALLVLGCARSEAVSLTHDEVLSSRSETTRPAPSGLAIELTEMGSTDGVVAGSVSQLYSCQTTVYQDVRRTDTTGSRMVNGWPQVLLGGAALTPGVYLLAKAPTYSDVTPAGEKSSSRDQAYVWGSLFTATGAVLLGHAGALWFKSGTKESTALEARKRPQPAVECQRAPAPGLKVGLVGTAELASVKSDDSGKFRLDLDDLRADLPLTAAAPELTLTVEQQAKTFRPIDWWTAHLLGRKQVLLERMAEQQRACDDGEALACLNLGSILVNGQDVLRIQKDLGKAKALFERSCRAGNADACFELGLIYTHVSPMNEAEAARVYKRACDQKHAFACNNLGTMYESGSGGLTADLQTARRLFERACADKDEIACNNLEKARDKQAWQAKEAARAADVAQFRRTLQVGDDSHCGLVVEVKGPIAKVQAMVGEVWLKVDQLYRKGSQSCRFVNNVYVDP
jgi:hypothetical protein